MDHSSSTFGPPEAQQFVCRQDVSFPTVNNKHEQADLRFAGDLSAP
jgi:hypothetical protein